MQRQETILAMRFAGGVRYHLLRAVFEDGHYGHIDRLYLTVADQDVGEPRCRWAVITTHDKPICPVCEGDLAHQDSPRMHLAGDWNQTVECERGEACVLRLHATCPAEP
jgi:hypothetical protein